jgi:phage shock protein PspC (stress-responsive transcriptional regulator)
MEQTDTTTTESSTRAGRSQELVRPVHGRMVAGVGQGIAQYLGINPWIPRIIFVVTAFMGGLGVALYGAGWAFIRSEDEAESPADRVFSGASTTRSWIGLALIVVAGVIILDRFIFLRGDVVWALAFLVVGLLLYLGYIPVRPAGGPSEESSPESKEGVQQMTTTEAPETQTIESPSGDSPAGGATTPPIIPTPTPPELPPAKPKERSILGRLTIGVALLGMGVLAILDNLDGLAIDAHPRHYVALAVAIVGVGLLVGSVMGRARWLILVGAILIPALLFSPVFEYDWDRSEFSHLQTPATFDQLQGSYDVEVGSLIIDLRNLPWDGEEIVINASVDAGNLELFIPDDVGIIGEAVVDVGRVSAPGRVNAGVGDPRLEFEDRGENGTVLLNAEVNIGNIEIWR